MTATNETLYRAAIHKNLVAVRELFSDPAKYTSRAYARDARGWATSSLMPIYGEGGETTWAPNPDATCFCFMGAYRRVTHTMMDDEVERKLNQLAYDRFTDHFMMVSDRGYENCLEMVDYFIAEFAPPPPPAGPDEAEAAQ